MWPAYLLTAPAPVLCASPDTRGGAAEAWAGYKLMWPSSVETRIKSPLGEYLALEMAGANVEDL